MKTELLASLDSIRAHLASGRLPEPVGVYVTTWTAPVKVQLDELDLPGLTGALLAWAEALEGITGTVWRVPDGSRVHVEICGLLGSGVLVCVYGSVTFAPAVFPDLPRDTEQDVPLFVLRGWAREEVGSEHDSR